MAGQWERWLVWKQPPTFIHGAAATNIRTLNLPDANNHNVEIDNDVLFPNNVPSQPASNQGELPASGDVLIAVQVEGTNDAWILFAGSSADATIDNTDATATTKGLRIKTGTGPMYFVINPRIHKWLAARAAPAGTSFIRYWVASPMSNNRS